ncbi:MAG TPA: sigma-70 family RNA polymerase sigma factor [Polyangia bacterium]|nr:sigma-70 family RNA polymerase sigma factor [Polyangia bacterium]
MSLVAYHTERERLADDAMARYAQGEEEAFFAVYDHVAPYVRRYLRRRLAEEASVEDLIQQTFLLLHANRHSFVPGAPILPWAVSIARNAMNEQFRKRRREQAYAHAPGANLIDRLRMAVAITSEDVLRAQETSARLVAVFEGLPERQRRALHMVRVDGLSHCQVAQELGTTTVAVKQLVWKASEKMKAVVAG